MQRKALKLTILGAQSVPPALPDAADPEVHVWRDPDGSVCAYGHTVSGEHWMHLPGLASFRFSDGTDHVIAIAHWSAEPDRIQDAYYRSVLPMALQALGQEGLHASGVRMPRGVVAFCAAKGTGKSTIAFALSRRGYPLWADDTVAFEIGDRCVRAIRLPFKSRLRPAAASFFGQAYPAMRLGARWDNADSVEVEPDPLAALCVLEQVPRLRGNFVVESSRLSSAEALLTVLPHAHCFGLQDAERKRRMTQHYLKLIARVPVFQIRFQTGLEKLPAILDGIEQAVTTEG